MLVSLFNPQTIITPAAFETGTTLDGAPNGTGPFRLDSYDEGGSANFVRNPDWWGGQTPLDAIELQTFDSIDTAVTAMREGSIDALQQFQVIGGEALLEADDFTTIVQAGSAHRRIWMNTQNGNEFTDKLVRQAVAWCLDREEMVDLLFAGGARIANDHQVLESLPFYDPDAVEQRSKNVDRARELLAEAGVDEINAVLNTGDIQDIPDLAAIVQRNCAEAGINLEINTQPNSTFYGDSWCPESAEGEPPCFNSDPIGIVDWGHRPVPDVYFTSNLTTGGVWNASRVREPGVRLPGRGVRGLEDRRGTDGSDLGDPEDPLGGRARRHPLFLRLSVRPLDRGRRRGGHRPRSHHLGRCDARRVARPSPDPGPTRV